MSGSPRWRSSREFLSGALAQLTHVGRPAVITVPAPLARPAALIEHTSERPAVLWQTPFGRAMSGFGEAARLTAPAEARMELLREGASALRERFLRVDHPDAPAPPPRFLGGLSFDPGAKTEAAWSDFPHAFFFLPRWSYERDAGRAYLRLALAGGAPAPRASDLLAEFDRLVALLELDPEPPSFDPGDVTVSEHEIDAWRDYVVRTRDAIREGLFEKVVVARMNLAESEREMDPLALVARLPGEHAGSTAFALTIAPGGATFLGASPETLISVSGTHIASDPLAGSIAASDAPNGAADREQRAASLLASRKDAAEHALVVENVARSLAPLVRELDVPRAPRIRSDRHVLHLHTPIRGELASPRHVLEFLSALHPTPSVGGVPTDAALHWIRRLEPAARGWYAGPVGWFDTEGDGEFVIAIRSGLVRGTTARIYAGAGIVADSDAEAEYQETVVKLRPFLRALGAPAGPREGIVASRTDQA